MQIDKLKEAVEFFDAWKDGEAREVMESREHLQVLVDLACSVLDGQCMVKEYRNPEWYRPPNLNEWKHLQFIDGKTYIDGVEYQRVYGGKE